MENEAITDNAPQPEVLSDLGDGPTTPLQHKNPEAETPAPEPAKPQTASDAIKAAMAKVAADEAKGTDSQGGKKDEEADDPKGKEADSQEGKPQELKKDDGKAPQEDNGAKVPVKAGGEEPAKGEQSEGEFLKVPSRLLPSERDHWGNVPHTVKRAIHRLEADFAAQADTHREATEFHQSLRQYDEMAKAAKTTIPEALGRYVEVDKMLAQDFGRGMASIAQSHGKNPVEAVAQFMRAAGVMPQQLGAYLQGQPVQQQPQSQQQRQADPVAQAALQRVQQLEQALMAQQQEAQARAEAEQARATHIAPYERQYGDAWAEMKPWVAKYYNSDIIDPSLSPEVRLREAVYEAERKVAPPRAAPDRTADLDDNVASLAAKKSISGAPGKSSTSSGKPKIMSIKEAIAAADRAHRL